MYNYRLPLLSQGTSGGKLTWDMTRQNSCHLLLNHDIIQKPFLIGNEVSDFTKFTLLPHRQWACGLLVVQMTCPELPKAL